MSEPMSEPLTKRLDLPHLSLERLPPSFFARPTPELAPAFLGLYLVRQRENGDVLVGRIVEVEAYHGMDDTACHARVGMTERTAVMFGPPGHAYVYLIYGMYSMLNVSTNPAGEPGAVLIRAMEPVYGIESMLALRRLSQKHPAESRGAPPLPLSNGPGKVCGALDIDRRLNGVDMLTGSQLWLARPVQAEQNETPATSLEVQTSPRVGIDYAEPLHRDIHWRFFERSNRWVSNVKATKASTRAKRA